MAILVTGGLGYIGSHVVRTLRGGGLNALVVDRGAIVGETTRDATRFQLDLVSHEAVGELHRILVDHDVTAVIHLAALKQVEESVRMPAMYYRENLGGLANLLSATEGSPVRSFVFSSSAAVYGPVSRGTVEEDDALHPSSPYGETKLAGEWLVRAAADALGIRALSLRYFNVAGAGWPDLGDKQAQNLLSIAIKTVHEGGVPVIFGDDYATSDGTGVRDYVHVEDLAAAHVAGLTYLEEAERPAKALNVGTGSGVTVREVLDELNRVSGAGFTPRIAPRRRGDPASVVADVRLAGRELGWTADRGISAMVESAWRAHLWGLDQDGEHSATPNHGSQAVIR